MTKVRPSFPLLTVALAVMFALSVTAFIIATLFAQQSHDEKLSQAQREVNGNQAMIFAVCRAFHRRDLFEQKRIDKIKKIEFHYQSMVKPFSPTVQAYFKARRQTIAQNSMIEEQKFVNFDCTKAMEHAYAEGYKDTSTPTGRPVPSASPPRPPGRPRQVSYEPRTCEALSFTEFCR